MIRKPISILYIALTALLVGWGMFALPTAGQETRDGAIRRESLSTYLPRLPWNDAERGPLLIVDPANILPSSNAQGKPITPVVSARSLSLRTLADYFYCREFSTGSLSVLIPAEMLVLNPKPGPPKANYQTELVKAVRFLITLDKAQVSLLTGPQGIGLNDLKSEQREKFLALLPRQITIRRLETHWEEKRITSDFGTPYRIEGLWPTAVEKGGETLSEEERRNVRFRIERTLTARLSHAGMKGGGPFLAGLRTPDSRPILEMDRNVYPQRERGTSFGVPLEERLPNRLKPSHLNYAAPILNQTISFQGVGTVGALIRRVAETTGLELIADRRVAFLPVWISNPNTSARAGDILQVLSLSISGAFRRVGPTYLLTQDTEGIAPRTWRLVEWQHNVAKPLADDYRTLKERIAREAWADRLSVDETVGIVETEGIRTALQERRDKTRFLYLTATVPMSALDTKNQTTIRQMLPAVHSETPIDLEKVQIEERFSVSFVLPGRGSAEAPYMQFALDDMLARARRTILPTEEKLPIALPASARYRALCVPTASVATAESARAVIREASRRGFGTVWVTLGAEDALLPLRLAIASAKQEKPTVGIGAMVRLLRSPNALSEIQKDRDLWGRTSQLDGVVWRRADIPETSAALHARLNAIAAEPGLAALAFTDTTPFGYVLRQPLPTNGNYLGGVRSRHDNHSFGFTPEMRLAFLRKESIDPLDFPAYESGLGFPFFGRNRLRPTYQGTVPGGLIPQMPEDSVEPEHATLLLMEKWDRMRNAANVRLLSDLHTVLRRKYPSLPLYIRSNYSEPVSPLNGGYWFGSWDRPDALPVRHGGTRETPDPSARRVSRQIFHAVIMPAPSEIAREQATVADIRPPERFLAEKLAGPLHYTEGKWDGFVLDLSDQPADQLLPLLEKLIAPK